MDIKGLRYTCLKCFNILKENCNTWKMKVNVGKTKVMVFRKSGLLPMNLNFEYYGEIIEIVNVFSYLGIVFTAHLIKPI